MYQPRRAGSAPDSLDPVSLDAAFSNAPRRAARTRLELVRTRLAPTAVSLALLAGVTAFSVNLKASEATTAVPAPARADEAASRSDERAALETAEDLAESQPATEEEAAEETAAAPVEGEGGEAVTFAAGNWTAAFGTMAGEKFAQSSATVRAGAGSESKALGKLKAAEKISVTDKVANGYRQVSWNGKVAWVFDNLLGDKAPVIEKPKPKPAPAPAKASTAKASSTKSSTKASAPAASAPAPTKATSSKSVLGLKPKAMVVYNAVTARWSFSAIGGYRATNNRSNHGSGGAIDFMTYKDSAKGWAVANYLAANADAFGIDHIIFAQKIWTPYRPYWRAMEDRGSVTANHYDHVHVSVKL